jgi:hypothetical protein
MVSVLAVLVLLFGCKSLRYQKKGKFEIADWIGLTAGEKQTFSNSLTLDAQLTSASGDIVWACWSKYIDEDMPAYIREVDIDSFYCEIENLDSLRDVSLYFYVSEDSLQCQENYIDSLATKIATIHLGPAGQLAVNGGNFNIYFSNLDLLVDIIRDGNFWAYVMASGLSRVNVGVLNYILYVHITGGLF